MEYKTIEDLGDMQGKVVMLRADLNVPMDENFHVTNDARIVRTVPTIKLLKKKEYFHFSFLINLFNLLFIIIGKL